jgi:hypothetical protein
MPIYKETNLDYSKSYLDINFFPDDNSIITDPLKLFLQEIFLSIQCGVDGVWGLGESINIQRYLFNQHISLTQIQNDISNYIIKNCSHSGNFSWSCIAETLRDEESNKEIIYITFKILVNDENGKPTEVIEKFLLTGK